jgi:hypothetical protein
MFGLIRKRAKEALDRRDRADEPNPAVALAVGLVWMFRTAAGSKMIRELETAVRRYSADPQALWKLVREGELADPARGSQPDRGDVIDTTLAETKELPGK